MDPATAQLKSEGNNLFLQKDYKNAATKYTAAIEHLPSSESTGKDLAVLHANRAACYLNLRQYMDAFADAERAATLNPTYSKAWARRATAEVALGRHDAAAVHWEKALACLPKQNLTPAEKVQREEFTAGIRAAKDKAYDQEVNHLTYKAGTSMPWQLAEGLLPALRGQEDCFSSTFMQGMNKIMTVEQVGPGWRGQTNALREMLNGILIDNRVFHLTDPKFPKKWTAQTKFECLQIGAMDLIGLGPENLIKKAQSLLADGQFEQRREAIELIICTWILRGYLEGNFSGRPDLNVEMIGSALKVLEWGRTNLTELPDGSIFHDVYVWPIRALYLESCMSCRAAARGTPDQSNLPLLEHLLTESGRVIREIKAAYPEWTPGDPDLTKSSVIQSFAQAHSMQGYYYAQLGEIAQDTSTRQNNFMLASQSYKRAARSYPEDDEIYPWFLHCALTNGAHSGRMSYEAALSLLEEIRSAAPKMMKIWANTAMAQGGRDKTLNSAMLMETRLRENIEKGLISKSGILVIEDWNP